MVPFGLQTVTPQHVGVDQSKPFSLVKLVGPSAAVCKRYEKLLRMAQKLVGVRAAHAVQDLGFYVTTSTWKKWVPMGQVLQDSAFVAKGSYA